MQIRAKAGIDRIGRGEREKDAVVVTEIPYQVNKARLIEKIAELVHEKRLDGISELRDESNREGMRIVIELKRDAVPQVVLNKLYKLTPMQSSFGIHQSGNHRRAAEGDESQADFEAFAIFAAKSFVAAPNTNSKGTRRAHIWKACTKPSTRSIKSFR